MIADAEAVCGRKNFIIIILTENIPTNKMPRELRTYMRTYTYIDATKNIDKVMKRLRSVADLFSFIFLGFVYSGRVHFS